MVSHRFDLIDRITERLVLERFCDCDQTCNGIIDTLKGYGYSASISCQPADFGRMFSVVLHVSDMYTGQPVYGLRTILDRDVLEQPRDARLHMGIPMPVAYAIRDMFERAVREIPNPVNKDPTTSRVFGTSAQLPEGHVEKTTPLPKKKKASPKKEKSDNFWR